MSEPSPSQQIDAIIAALHPDWRGQKLAQLRNIVTAAHPAITEAVKWKKPSRPEGVAVWVSGGNICIGDVLKNAVRLTFPQGALLPDPHHLFNTRLDSKSVRAIDFAEHDDVNGPALTDLVRSAVIS